MTLELESILHNKILPTKLLGFKVEKCDNGLVSLSAPIILNYNDKNTGFGGSLEMLSIITGWSCAWKLAQEKKIETSIVIRKSSSSFLAPAISDFLAICKAPEANSLINTWNQLEKKGKAKIKLNINLYSNSILCLQTQAEYVFLKMN